ncbi:peptidoglycan DD-metalloendopeptidase family protein [Leucobacter sp. W1478]|uniref:peptidoglycan DD-metalloendopeptidase family protein n=1 Tax=Leucobacter sp. W1478 TaxID=3439065 RepID=UPI003F2F4E09
MRKQSQTRRTRWIAGFAIAAILGTGLVGAGTGSVPAQALDLPSWADVEAAKQNEATAAAKVIEIEGLIAQGEAELERLRNLHADSVSAFQDAEAAFQAAARKSETLDAQAEQSRIEAEAATAQAAALVSQMYRSGGVDRNVELFLESEGDTADALLERLASMSKATERNTAISEEAQQAMNTAASLGEQAEVAEQQRETLKVEKENLEQAAAEAVAGQAEALQAQEEQQTVLETQLAALKDTTTSTVAGYQERLRLEEEERQRLAREAEAARIAAEKAAAEAAANAGNSGGGGGGNNAGNGGGGGGTVGAWYVPIPYSYISTYFQQWWGHTGVDLVNGCGVPIVAPNSGTIGFVGWMDNTGGNMIYLNHGNGYQTRFAHLSRFNVGYGQWVNAGQVIGYVGTTGMSTGCHLHYEVLRGGVFIDPVGNGFV